MMRKFELSMLRNGRWIAKDTTFKSNRREALAFFAHFYGLTRSSREPWRVRVWSPRGCPTA